MALVVVEAVAPSSAGGTICLPHRVLLPLLAQVTEAPVAARLGSSINLPWWPELEAQGLTDKGLLSSTPASRTESPVEFTTSPLRCSPTKQVSGFARPPATHPGEEGTIAPFNFPRSRSFPPVRSPVSLPLAQDERTRKAPAAGKRDRAGLPAGPTAAPDCGIIFWTDPKSRQLLKPGASSPGQDRHRPSAARPPPHPAPHALPFPRPPRIPTGAGPGASGCSEGARPCGTIPAPPGAQPDVFLQRRAPGTPSQSSGPQSDVHDRPRNARSWSGRRGSRPFRKVPANLAMGRNLCVI